LQVANSYRLISGSLHLPITIYIIMRKKVKNEFDWFVHMVARELQRKNISMQKEIEEWGREQTRPRKGSLGRDTLKAQIDHLYLFHSNSNIYIK